MKGPCYQGLGAATRLPYSAMITGGPAVRKENLSVPMGDRFEEVKADEPGLWFRKVPDPEEEE